MKKELPEDQKLDRYSKILLATQSIQYMANCLSTTNMQIRMLCSTMNEDDAKIHLPGCESKDEILDDAIEKLSSIMEEMGNIMNAHDTISPIDIKVTSPAFDIVVHGHDDVESSKFINEI